MGKCSYITLGLFGLVMLMQRGEATTFTVGGSKGWSAPSDNGALYNQWAEKNRFQIGDSLLFVYQSSDSVLQVSKDDFTNCNTNTPLAKFTDGHTEFKFNQSGPYYFISGNKDNCNKNEKIVVVVLADRSAKNSPPAPTTPVAPAPTPAVTASPPAPTTTTEASPAPSTEASPPPPPSGASSIVMSLGCVGALLGSSIILAF